MGIWKDFHYGVCYFPEHWHPNRHADDIKRIADTGMNIVRMAEGAWATFEPVEGEFHFDLFDNVIDLCAKHGLKVIMGTPTYAAPAWVSHKYPEVLRWNYNRIPMKHGSRRNFNYTSPVYLDLSDRICTALADHYKKAKPVIGWQLDNELNCHMDVSYAPADTLAFRKWLRAKYKTLDRLNAAWGTAFWSLVYSEWDQIDLPHPTPTYPNPTHLLDESRFISDCVVNFAKRQAAILRKANGKWLITHNHLFANLNGPELTKALDFFSHDHYPMFWKEGDWSTYAAGLRQARGLSLPFGIMEQQAGPGGQENYLQRTPRPGEMRLWTWQSIAHGAKTLLHFRLRTCPYGAEQHWHGLLDADNRDNRRIAEAKQIAAESKKLPPAFFDAPLTRVVAVLRDYDNGINEARINTYTGDGRFAYNRWAGAFSRKHIPCDEVWPESNLRGYKVLILPHTKIIDKPLVDELTAFVKAGGTLVITAQSGSKDKNCHIVEQPMPGLLRKLAGVEVEDWTTLPADQTRDSHFAGDTTIPFAYFVERLKPFSAKVVATWAGEDTLLAGAPAITLNSLGKGRVYYIGGYQDQASTDLLAERVAVALNLQPPAHATEAVEMIERGSGKKRWLVLMNHHATQQEVTAVPCSTDLLTGKTIKDGQVTLAPYAVAVLAIS